MLKEEKRLENAPLDQKRVRSILKKDGPIGKNLAIFEERDEQLKILDALVTAFNENGIALIEAGTGTGKSLAYLVPSFLAASIWKERVVISTHTIALQEQIISKDLPLIKKSLGIDLKTALVKGMNNYVCLRKLEEIGIQKVFLSEEDKLSLEKIEEAVREKGKGCKSGLPVIPSHAVSELVFADQDNCSGNLCPHYNNCFYFEDRKQSMSADLLIVNHHLLLSDLTVRKDTDNYTETAILPNYAHIILDEAHHLEEIATHFFADKASKLKILKTLSRLSSEKATAPPGKLAILKSLISKGNEGKGDSPLFMELTLELPSLKKDLLKSISDFYHALETITDSRGEQEENTFRIEPHHLEEKMWKEGIFPLGTHCINLLQRYGRALERLDSKVKELDNDKLYDRCKSVLFEIKTLGKKIQDEGAVIKKLIETPPTKSEIRWIETYMSKAVSNTSLTEASLNIAKVLQKYLFAPFKTIGLFSATLTTKQNFKYMRERLGLTEELLEGRAVIESEVGTTFNFEKQSLFIIPKDIVDPSHPNFLEEAKNIILDALTASKGNAFILFTSYGMLKAAFQLLENSLREKNFHPLKQGDESRQTLISKFKEKEGSVLFGTATFWEGVDVVGEALRLVIIAKLPFSVPTEPLTEARSEALAEEGKSAFYELLLPQAAIKLKQGFGRLIRNKKDRGCILCLDNRLIKKSYGKYLLSSLPKAPLLILPKSEIKNEMIAFYRKTQYLTKP